MDRTAITSELVSRLVRDQFPEWGGLPVRRVEPGGWDNVTFRLGSDMSVRLPSGPGYAGQVEKEHRWLPGFAGQLPLPIPVPLARGAPGCGFPWSWSVYRWLPGEPAATARLADPVAFAADLAGFLTALYRIDTVGGPPPGKHSCLRGAPLAVWDADARRALKELDGEIDTARAAQVWAEALAAPWPGPPVWVHGDVADGNLLVNRGRLSAVIDFGCWALWKAMIVLVGALKDDPADAIATRHVIAEVLAEGDGPAVVAEISWLRCRVQRPLP